MLAYIKLILGLPGDTVIVAVIARSAPHCAVRLIEKDRVDRPRSSFLKRQRIAHLYKFVANRLRR